MERPVTVQNARLFKGLAASGGLVFAPVVRFEAEKIREAPRYEVLPTQLNAEIARFYTALDRASPTCRTREDHGDTRFFFGGGHL